MEEPREEFVMPFGQHKGSYIHTLPSTYLFWLAQNCDWWEDVQLAADEEYQYREQYNCHL